MVTLEHSMTGHQFFLRVIFTEPTRTIKLLNLKLAGEGPFAPRKSVTSKAKMIDNLRLN